MEVRHVIECGCNDVQDINCIVAVVFPEFKEGFRSDRRREFHAANRQEEDEREWGGNK